MAGRPEEEGHDGVDRRLPSGRDRTVAGGVGAGGCQLLPEHGAGRAGRYRPPRARAGATADLRRADRRHGRPPRRRRGHDAGGRGLARRVAPDRDAVRDRRHAGSGRGQYRAGVCRAAAADRRHPDQARRRCARRRSAFGAPRDRQAGQVRRRGREDRRAGALRPRTHGRPRAWHGRYRLPGRGRAKVDRRQGGREVRAADEVGREVRPQ